MVIGGSLAPPRDPELAVVPVNLEAQGRTGYPSASISLGHVHLEPFRLRTQLVFRSSAFSFASNKNCGFQEHTDELKLVQARFSFWRVSRASRLKIHGTW